MTLNDFLPPLPAATNKYIIFFNTSQSITHLIPPNGASEGLTCGEARKTRRELASLQEYDNVQMYSLSDVVRQILRDDH